MHQVEKLPREPGVYLFKNGEGHIIYIGKAKSLRSRVKSYFGKGLPPKTRAMVSHIAHVDYFIVHNEVEALLLENRLIKQHKPKYNIDLKDGKTYAYLKLTEERYPRVHSTRKVAGKGEYFGPYTDGRARNEILRLVSGVFKLRTCKRLPKRPCLNYHIGLCTAPCARKISDEEYSLQVAGARAFLRGDVKDTLSRLRSEMAAASESLDFEQALDRKHQIEAIEHHMRRQSVDLIRKDNQDAIAHRIDGDKASFTVLSVRKGVVRGKEEFVLEREDDVFEGFIKAFYAKRDIPNEILVNEEFWKSDAEHAVLCEYLLRLKGTRARILCPRRGSKRALVDIAEKNIRANDSLQSIADALNLPEAPQVIECFDVSNLGRDHIVAGMVRFVSGRPDTRGYRRFLMRSVSDPDDFASMREAVLRRYRKEEDDPDLIVVDGGRGQLHAALSALEEAGKRIPVVALAKREEELYLPGESLPQKHPKGSAMMLLLRRIRDEAHRYALAYNRKRREMRLRDSGKP